MKDNSGRKATKSPTDDNAKQSHGTDDGTQDDYEEIFTLEDIMNH